MTNANADAYTNGLRLTMTYRGFVYDGGHTFHCAECGACIAWRFLTRHARWHARVDGWPWEIRTDADGLYMLQDPARD